MAQSFLKKAVMGTAVILIVFLLANAAARGEYQFTYAEQIIMTVVSPVEGVLSRMGYGLRSVFTSTGKVFSVYRDNQQLQQEIEDLRQTNINVNEIKAENVRLKGLLDYKQTAPQFDLVAATVVARDPGSWTQIVIINRGTASGIAKDMPVITPQGLVGSVIEVYGHVAKVQLFLDPRSAVGGIVQRPESRVAGIVEGNGENSYAPHMVNLARDADVIKGDKIITSGLGGIFPKGLLIGEVTDVANDEGGLLKIVTMKPAVDFSRLEDVFVILHARDPLPADVLSTVGASQGRGGSAK